MFLDATAILAILLNEAEAALFVEKIKHAKKLYYSAIVKYEVIVRLADIKSQGNGNYQEHIAKAQDFFKCFVETFKLQIIVLSDHECNLALEAHYKYGKKTGHPAQLNMGDCYSLGCCTSYKQALLFKGDDFIHTDVKQA